MTFSVISNRPPVVPPVGSTLTIMSVPAQTGDDPIVVQITLCYTGYKTEGRFAEKNRALSNMVSAALENRWVCFEHVWKTSYIRAATSSLFCVLERLTEYEMTGCSNAVPLTGLFLHGFLSGLSLLLPFYLMGSWKPSPLSPAAHVKTAKKYHLSHIFSV